MIHTLSKPVRRLLAVALLVIPVGAGFAALNPVLSHVADLRDRIGQERQMLAKLTALTSDGSAKRTLEEQTKAAKASGIFIEGESESIRLSTLQSNLSAIAAANGVKLRSARNLASRDKNDLRLIGVQLQLVAPLDRLQKILLDLEQAKPALFVDALQITPLAGSRLPDDDRAGLLDTRFDVFAVEPRQKG